MCFLNKNPSNSSMIRKMKQNIIFDNMKETDLDDIIQLFQQETGRALNKNRLLEEVKNFPSLIIKISSELVGFIYSTKFAPDILEIMNLYISKYHRSHGLGRKLLEEFEKVALKNFNAIILVNSLLYNTIEEKRLATSFYLNCNYSIAMSTNVTNIFVKKLKT